MEKRFAVFKYEYHEQRGGWSDFRAAFGKIDEAVAYIKTRNTDFDTYYCEIVDLENLVVVWDSS